MTKEQYEKELELRWKEFWDAIVIMTGPGEHFNYYLPGSQFPSLIGRQFISEVNRVALLYADDLISQSMKGGAE